MTVDAAQVIGAVESGPAGPKVGAFFDLDGTIVQGYTAGTFYSERIRRGDISAGELTRTLVAAVDGTILGGNPQVLGEVSFASLQGRSEDEIAEIGERLFVQKIAGTIRPEARELVRAHLRVGHTVAVASSATRPQIEPVARDLGIPHVLCTELEAEGGILTGRSTTGMVWGDRKAKAVRRFAREYRIDLPSSYAYGNGQEDIAFLGTVGRPHALNPHPVLRKAAEQYDWPVLILREPKSPGLRSYLGTAAALAGTNAGLAAGALFGLVNQDRRAGINAGIQLAADTALAVAGVKLNVIGEENLWKARPAVFIANHQSSLDAFIFGALLRRDFTAVAKKEARYDPRMLLMSAVIDPAFIDRGNIDKAKQTMAAVVQRLRDGTSIVIAPEGTRMATPTLGRFKKGAFHIAMQAEVPIVPIVIRNAGELMWRRSMIINPGTVDVAVLDPIPTDDWSLRNLSRNVNAIRQRYIDTLENWPKGETR
jgi:putative phosphoserine phosphatase/1-acylglycerol-3-phosphate O-acyltransferase